MPNSVREKGKIGMYYVYILQCGDGTYYTGSTTDLERRLDAHANGRGAKYTRGRGPLRLVYREEVESWPAALRREAAIKKLTRAQKIALIAQSAHHEKKT